MSYYIVTAKIDGVWYVASDNELFSGDEPDFKGFVDEHAREDQDFKVLFVEVNSTGDIITTDHTDQWKKKAADGLVEDLVEGCDFELPEWAEKKDLREEASMILSGRW